MVSAPKIDPRTRQEILNALKDYATEYSDWRASHSMDAGQALMTIFSHMVEDIQVRLNQVPDKNLLAFLNLDPLLFHGPLKFELRL